MGKREYTYKGKKAGWEKVDRLFQTYLLGEDGVILQANLLPDSRVADRWCLALLGTTSDDPDLVVS